MNVVVNIENPQEFFSNSKENDYNQIENSAFKYKEDKWDISLLLDEPQNKPITSKKISFDTLPKNLYSIIKRHTYYLFGSSSVQPHTAIHMVNLGKSELVEFMDKWNLKSLNEFDTEMFINFNLWLRQTYITEYAILEKEFLEKIKKETNKQEKESLLRKQKKYKPRSEATLYMKAKWLKRLLDDSLKFGWEDGAIEPIILGDTSLAEIWNNTGRKNSEKFQKTSAKKLIPRSIWNKIIHAAKTEEKFRMTNQGNLFIYRSGQAEGIVAVNFMKYLILILAFSGLRVSEVVTLKSACIFKDRWNRHWLHRRTTKTVNEPEDGDIRIPEMLYETIKELREITMDYRIQSGIDGLFFSIYHNKNNSIAKMSMVYDISYKMKLFLNRNEIYDDNCEVYHLTSHMFRHTFASILVNDYNVSLTTLMRHYSHMSLEMTMYYVHLSKEKIQQRALAGFAHTEKILYSGKEGKQFVEKLNEAKAEEDLESALLKLADMFGVNSLPFGLCLYDYRRGHCPHLGVQSCWEIGCKDFITSDSFLMNFEHERDILEKQIKRDKKLGQIASAKMKNIKFGKIVKIIGQLSDNKEA